MKRIAALCAVCALYAGTALAEAPAAGHEAAPAQAQEQKETVAKTETHDSSADKAPPAKAEEVSAGSKVEEKSSDSKGSEVKTEAKAETKK